MKSTEETFERSRKSRSPNYPAISLPDAISRAELVFKKEHRHVASAEVIAKAIGYAGLSGTSTTVVSALKKYGLLDESDKGLKISDAALVILVDHKNSQDRIAAVRKAAQSPPLFAELQSHYGDEIPSDENLRSYLLKKNFLPGTVDAAIRAYRETVEYVQIQAPRQPIQKESTDRPKQDEGELSKSEAKSKHSMPDRRPLSDNVVDQLVYRLSHNCSVTVSFDGPVTTKKIDKLIALLELNKDVYLDEEVPPAIST